MGNQSVRPAPGSEEYCIEGREESWKGLNVENQSRGLALFGLICNPSGQQAAAVEACDIRFSLLALEELSDITWPLRYD